jgi:hypothetical protein
MTRPSLKSCQSNRQYHLVSMKLCSITIRAFIALSCCSLSFAQNPSAARVLGAIPDGTPPAPEPAKPGFVVAKKDVLDSQVHFQDGRKITVQRIKPIALPPPAEVAPTVADSATFREQLAAARAAQPKTELLGISATVYRSKNSAPHTLVRISAMNSGEKEETTFWSSADFAYLSGFASFVGNDGITRNLMMAWGNQDIDGTKELLAKHDREYTAPKIPNLPKGKATFIITSAPASTEMLASIQALHDVYNNEYDRLKLAYESREQARLRDEAERKANPPKPKDITLNYWRIDAKDISNKKGSTR